MKEQVIKVVGGEITTRLKTASYTHFGQSPIARGGGLGGGGQMLIGPNNIIKKLKQTQHVQVPVIERWTQTDISLPVNLPIYVEQLLWQYSQVNKFFKLQKHLIIVITTYHHLKNYVYLFKIGHRSLWYLWRRSCNLFQLPKISNLLLLQHS